MGLPVYEPIADESPLEDVAEQEVPSLSAFTYLFIIGINLITFLLGDALFRFNQRFVKWIISSEWVTSVMFLIYVVSLIVCLVVPKSWKRTRLAVTVPCLVLMFLLFSMVPYCEAVFVYSFMISLFIFIQRKKIAKSCQRNVESESVDIDLSETVIKSV